jgi:hypothetical protein
LKSRRIEAEQQVAIDMDGPLAMAAIAAQESAEASE